MIEINDGGPAFPESGLSGLPNGEFIHGRSGMTLRDYFAAKAMQAIVTQPTWETCPVEKVACWSYEQADAMLKAREL